MEKLQKMTEKDILKSEEALEIHNSWRKRYHITYSILYSILNKDNKNILSFVTKDRPKTDQDVLNLLYLKQTRILDAELTSRIVNIENEIQKYENSLKNSNGSIRKTEFFQQYVQDIMLEKEHFRDQMDIILEKIKHLQSFSQEKIKTVQLDNNISSPKLY